MQPITVTQVSRAFGISARMLRYYEQNGLLHSHRREGYAYRMYDEEAIRRLQQIQVLRRLRIPVKEIALILGNPDAVTAVSVFTKNLRELDEQITSLSTIREILHHFVAELQRSAGRPIHSLLTQDNSVVEIVQSLAVMGIDFREDQTMNNLQQASQTLETIRDARIIFVPPATVAAAHHIGDNPEQHANAEIGEFVRQTGLCHSKPDLRCFGFNHPNPTDASGRYGYEAWVTIPDDLAVPPPLIKKRFAGGLYAAHTVYIGGFDMWDKLLEWVTTSDKYEFAGDFADQEHMCGLLDEHLNYRNHALLQDTEPEDTQYDLLMPVREKRR